MHTGQSRVAIAHRRQEASRLYLEGKTQLEIAEQLGVNQSVISRDLQFLRSLWRRVAVENVEEVMSQKLAELARIKRESWEQWHRSKLDATTLTVETVEGKEGEPREVKRMQKKGQCGDSRYVDTILRCVIKECELLGLDPPKRSELTGPNGGPVVLVAGKRIEELTDEELAQELARIDQQQRATGATIEGFPRIATQEVPDATA